MRASILCAALAAAAALQAAEPVEPKQAPPPRAATKKFHEPIPVPLVMPARPAPESPETETVTDVADGEPPFTVVPRNTPPDVLHTLTRQLGADGYGTRERAEAELKRLGWDGFVAAQAALASECPETRARAVRVCNRYLLYRPPHNEYPRIYTMCCRYKDKYNPSGVPGDEPEDQYATALLSHYYTMRAIREEWESRASDPSRTGEPQWDSYASRYEERATQLMVRDLLRSGVNPEWVSWFLRDMDCRANYWPPALKSPPNWLAAWTGVQISYRPGG